MDHFTVTFRPDGKNIRIHAGATVLEAAAQAGIILNTPCGGKGTCGKCGVEIRGVIECSCQFLVREDLDVAIPPESRYFGHQILEHGISRELNADPRWKKLFFALSPPDRNSLAAAAGKELGCDVAARCPDFAPVPEGVTAVVLLTEEGAEITSVEAGDTRSLFYGVAADIGTTTVVVHLLDLNTAEVLETASAANPQAKYGDDVISRINHGSSEKGLDQLHSSILRCLNDLIGELCRRKGYGREHIYEAAAVGNTTMHHLLHRYPVFGLGQAPYAAHSTKCEDKQAGALKLDINPQGRLYTVGNIAGFVGSDTVAAALAAGMDMADELSLLVDIGTNGEIVLGSGKGLFAASCAAGPAMEGARIRFGSRAAEGAIQRVIANGDDIDVDVIGSGAAKSICGSGLLDAAALMLEMGIADSSGRLIAPEELRGKISEAVFSRLVQFEGQPGFILARNGSKPAVILTQKDLRELQLAKAAILAGITLLLKTMGHMPEEIQHVYLAGAFGNYLQKKNALRIGLLPEVAEDKIHFIGNAAAAGAQMILVNKDSRKEAEKLAQSLSYIEIALKPEFQDVFADCLFFPQG